MPAPIENPGEHTLEHGAQLSPEIREAILCYADGLSLFRNLKRETEDIPDKSQQVCALCALAVVAARTGRDPIGILQNAKELVEELRSRDERVHALTILAETEAEIGMDPAATFHKAKREAMSGLQTVRFTESMIGQHREESEERRRCSQLLVSIAEVEGKAERDPRITFREAGKIAGQINFDSDRDRALSTIAETKARMGLFHSARKTARKIEDKRDHSDALNFITEAEALAACLPAVRKKETMMYRVYQHVRALFSGKVGADEDQGGKLHEAKEMAKKLHEGCGENHYLRTQTFMAIVEAEAKAGLFHEAKETVKEVPGYNYYDWRFFRVLALTTIAEGEAMAGRDATETLRAAKGAARNIPHEDKVNRVRALAAIAKGEVHIAMTRMDGDAHGFLSRDEREKIFQAAVTSGNREVLTALGAILNPEEQQTFVQMLANDVQSGVQRLLDSGRAAALELGGTAEESSIRSRVRADIRTFLDRAEGKTAPEETVSLRPEFKIACRTLYNLDSETAKETLLETARSATGGVENPLFARLVHTLIDADTSKGNDLVVRVIGDERLPRHLAWLFMKKLCDMGYLDQKLTQVLDYQRKVYLKLHQKSSDDMSHRKCDK